MTLPFYRYLEVGIFSMLNMLPFLLLAIYPFRRHLRFSFSVTNLLVILLASVQICLGFLTAFQSVTSEIISLITIVIYAGFYLFVIKDHLGRLSFVLLFMSNLGNLVTVCAKCLEGMLFGSLALEPYRWSMLLCMAIMHVLITVPTLFYVRKYFSSSVPVKTKSWRYLWITPATFYLIWYYYLHFTGEDAMTLALDAHHAVFLLVINAGTFVVYHTAIMLLLEQKKNAELVQNNYHLSLYNLQHENLQQRINEARQAKHDVHHHTYLIREYLRSGKLKELDAYLEKYSASLPTTQYILYCQHYETNSLLGFFVQQAQQHGITMDVFVHLPERIRLPETTLSVLLGNLLENAIDACSEVTNGERKITVRGKFDNGFVFFDISNTYDGTLRKSMNGDFLSTKKKGQGLGMHSVAHLVREHNGVFEVDTTNQLFRVSVMLQEQMEPV